MSSRTLLGIYPDPVEGPDTRFVGKFVKVFQKDGSEHWFLAHVDDPETNLKFMGRIDEITGKQNTMGVLEQLAEIKEKEGLEKGRSEERRLLIKNRNGSFHSRRFLNTRKYRFPNKVKE
ncbi:MAG TPA: hypothetical protein VGN00_28770 [Puia sp.]